MRAYSRVKLGLLGSILRRSPPLQRVAAGYAAKSICAALFLSERELEPVLRQDLQLIPAEVEVEVDAERRLVKARVLGVERQAVMLEGGLGSVLLEHDQRPQLPALPARPVRTETAAPWPVGEQVDDSALDAGARARLAAVLDEAFAEPDPSRPRRTRAVAVVHRGRLVAERYAAGVKPETPLLGWSMTKSLTNALCGVLVGRGQLDLEQPLGAPEWSPGDPRAALTWDVLLRMSSGLRFWEQYWNPFSHVTGMLFNHPGAGAYAASFPLVARPDTRWSYASGTSNIITRALRGVLGGDHATYLRFPAEAVFDRIGAHSMVMETDASGHFVGSSFSYATARDWARFGQLYLQDGRWNDEQILPPGWAERSFRPTPTAPLGQYGSHFWLNAGCRGRRPCPAVPADAAFARGHEEQSVSIIPSRELVVVRLGQTADASAWNLERFLAGVLEALPDRPR